MNLFSHQVALQWATHHPEMAAEEFGKAVAAVALAVEATLKEFCRTLPAEPLEKWLRKSEQRYKWKLRA